MVDSKGHCWQMRNFYQPEIYPYQQAESQLLSLLNYFNNEPILRHQVTARVAIALPFIS